MKALQGFLFLRRCCQRAAMTMLAGLGLSCWTVESLADSPLLRPRFSVDPITDSIWGHGWPVGEMVTVTRGDPPDLLGVVEVDEQNDWELHSAERLMPGDLLQARSGAIEKSHEIQPLRVTLVDPDTDTVHGLSSPFTTVNVILYDAEPRRTVEVDEHGVWRANFAVALPGVPGGEAFDITSDTRGAAVQTDIDLNETHVRWWVPSAILGAHLTQSWLWGQDWPQRAIVQVSVGDPANPDVSFTIDTDAWGNWWRDLWYYDYTLQAEDLVQATSGVYRTSMRVAPLSVTGADPVANTLQGTATPNRPVQVYVRDVEIGATADLFGKWTANFGHLIKLEEGMEGSVRELDDDGNITEISWRYKLLNMDELEVGLLWLVGNTAIEFECMLEGEGLLAARLQTPVGEWHDLAIGGWDEQEWEIIVPESTYGALNARFPTGAYTLELSHYEGRTSSVLQVDASFVMPTETPAILAPAPFEVVANPVTLYWMATTDPVVNMLAVRLGAADPDPEFIAAGESEFGPVDLPPGMCVAAVYFLNAVFDLKNNDGIGYQLIKARFREHDFVRGHRVEYFGGPGGAVTGATQQIVIHGADGTEVGAVPETGTVFFRWSDGVAMPQRTEQDVAEDMEVTATFQSQGGVPIDWYDGHSIEPESGETWADVDTRYDALKRMTLVQQYVANTDPNDPESLLRILEFGLVPVPTAQFMAAPDRLYGLQSTTDLLLPDGWCEVAAKVYSGAGGALSLSDTNPPPFATRYRLQAEVPAP